MQTCRARLSWKGWLSMPLPPAIAFAIGGGAAHRQGRRRPGRHGHRRHGDVGNMPALGKLPPSSNACAAGDAEPPLDESPYRIATGKAIAPVAPHLYDDRHAVWRS
jgi:hypothetical protein